MANREMIVATLAAIEQDPEHHDQSTWMCGTGACLAGWAVLLAGYRVQMRFYEHDRRYLAPGGMGTLVVRNPDGEQIPAEFMRIAAEVLEIPNGDVREDGHYLGFLFDADNTLDRLYFLAAAALGETEESLREAVAKQRDYDPVDAGFFNAAVAELYDTEAARLAADIDSGVA